MKKITGFLALGFMAVLGASQAQAALITDWTYDLTNVSYTNINQDGKVTNDGFSWVTDKRVFGDEQSILISQDTSISPDGTLDFAGNTETVINDPNVTAMGNERAKQIAKDFNKNHLNKPLVTLNFAYTVTSTSADLSMTFEYSLPLRTMSGWSWQDLDDSNHFIYYNPAELVVTQIDPSGERRVLTEEGELPTVSFDGYTYKANNFAYVVDGQDMKSVSINNKEYVGWVLNSEDRNHKWYDYSPVLDFGINGSFSFTYAENRSSTPTPTPEPATMLLTGLGLAGLGAIKRRRNSK